MKIILAALIFTIGLTSYSQTKEFIFYDNVGNIEEPLSLNIYTQGELLNIQSDTKGKISLEKELIDEADSIFVNYSFYRLPLKKENFSKEIIQLKPEISLESVVLKEKKKQFLGPDQKKSVMRLSVKSDHLISTSTEDYSSKKIIGIRYRFKNKSLFWSGSSKNKRYKVVLYGHHEKAVESDIAKNNPNEAYDLLSNTPVSVSIPDNIPQWVEVYFDEPITHHNEYAFVAFGLQPIDVHIFLKQAQVEDYPGLTRVITNSIIIDGERKIFLYTPTYLTTKHRYIPNLQLILK